MSTDGDHAFQQNVIAVVWDFDQTLSPEYMQGPIFRHYQVEERAFWAETRQLVAEYLKQDIKVSKESIYLNHFLTYARLGRFGGLSNQRLREFGQEIRFFPGVEEMLPALKAQVADNQDCKRFDVRLEHYVVSTGLTAMVSGSRIAPQIDGIWGCEFIERPMIPGEGGLVSDPDALPIISQIARIIDHTSKTKALFEINKGANKHAEVDVNQMMPEPERRVPFSNMIYIADGPSDVPAFSLIKKCKGLALAVYNPAEPKSLVQADDLMNQGRVHMIGPADYQAGTHTRRWLEHQIQKIADGICSRKRSALVAGGASAPRHLV
jgi:hypothetical protein